MGTFLLKGRTRREQMHPNKLNKGAVVMVTGYHMVSASQIRVAKSPNANKLIYIYATSYSNVRKCTTTSSKNECR